MSSIEQKFGEAADRIIRDLDTEEFTAFFCLLKGAQPGALEVLGEETHNRGRSPLSVTISFNERPAVVYKPRSVISEYLLCNEDTSLFANLGLSTYKVFNKGDYGYCEYLMNSEETNTFHEHEEIKNLIIEYGKIDKIAKGLGLSDLHSENIILPNKRPCLTDTEIILLPTNVSAYESHLFAQERPGALAWSPKTKNRIWLTNELLLSYIQSVPAEGRGCFKKYKGQEEIADEQLIPLIKDALEDGLAPILELSHDLRELIHEIINNNQREVNEFSLADEILSPVRHQLMGEPHRIVLISTEELAGLIQQNPEEAKHEFIKLMQQGIEEWGFIFRADQREKVLEQFDRDLKNNDVPVFYHKANEKAFYYGDYPIGIQLLEIKLPLDELSGGVLPKE